MSDATRFGGNGVSTVDTRELLSPVWAHLSDRIIARGEGIYLFDTEGNQYIDFTSGIGVTSTGHCHPHVVEAIQKQAAELIFGQINCMIPPTAPALAAKLLPLMPDGLDCFFFSNSGAEAVEAAVKLAKNATGRTNVIAFEGSFHGRTHMTMALTGSKTIYRRGYQPLPSGVVFAPFPYAYRLGMSESEASAMCLSRLEYLLKSQTDPTETVAVLIEPVVGEGGYLPAPSEFLSGLRKICDKHGMLLIFDEVQSGFGRTGEWWGHSRSGVRPDIMVMAKGIASGMPLSAVAAPREVMDAWQIGTHGGTYGGGNAVAAAAAIATIETIESEDLVQNAMTIGEYLLNGLAVAQQHYPLIGDVRGWGLMVGAEFVRDLDTREPAPEMALAVTAACLERGLMLLRCGTSDNVIRWIPPLIVTREQVDEALDIFTDSLRSCS